MSLVLIRQSAPTQEWIEALALQCPELDVYVWPDTGPVDDVEYVLTWAAPPNAIARFPNLKAIFSLGAGVDHIVNDPTVPSSIPIIRMVDISLTTGMIRYVLMAVLQWQRALPTMLRNQSRQLWQRPKNSGERIGILGLGELGASCATALASLRYDVAGWSRTEKLICDVTCYASDTLTEFLERTDILVCLLPLTPSLHDVLCEELFNKLPRGAYLINAARGEHLIEADLIKALDSGQLAGAMLDVFREEPLPATHPFWSRTDIIITPHIASMTHPATAAQHVATNINRIRAGKAPHGNVVRALGY